jgi:hypothetical protein
LRWDCWLGGRWSADFSFTAEAEIYGATLIVDQGKMRGVVLPDGKVHAERLRDR